MAFRANWPIVIVWLNKDACRISKFIFAVDIAWLFFCVWSRANADVQYVCYILWNINCVKTVKTYKLCAVIILCWFTLQSPFPCMDIFGCVSHLKSFPQRLLTLKPSFFVNEERLLFVFAGYFSLKHVSSFSFHFLDPPTWQEQSEIPSSCGDNKHLVVAEC